MASVNDNSFFEAGHHIALNSNELIGSKDDLSKLIQEELQAIINDEELLKKFDKVAYIRFASVYRSFEDVETFYDELKELLAPTSTDKVKANKLKKK